MRCNLFVSEYKILSKRGTIVGRMEPCFDVRQSWDFFFVLVKDNEVLISGVRY